jgi:hypothetical protein
MSLQSDARVQWIRQRVVLGLDLQDDAFSYMLSPPKVRIRELAARKQYITNVCLSLDPRGSQQVRFQSCNFGASPCFAIIAVLDTGTQCLLACSLPPAAQDATNPGAGCGAAAVAAFLDGSAATASGSSTLFFFAEEEEVEVSREVEEQYEEQIPVETSAELLNGDGTAAGGDAGTEGAEASTKVSSKLLFMPSLRERCNYAHHVICLGSRTDAAISAYVQQQWQNPVSSCDAVSYSKHLYALLLHASNTHTRTARTHSLTDCVSTALHQR